MKLRASSSSVVKAAIVIGVVCRLSSWKRALTTSSAYSSDAAEPWAEAGPAVIDASTAATAAATGSERDDVRPRCASVI